MYYLKPFINHQMNDTDSAKVGKTKSKRSRKNDKPLSSYNKKRGFQKENVGKKLD